jgi:hypothetical protein
MTVFITISDIASIAAGILVTVLLAAFWLDSAWRQWRCKHTGSIGETQACDAICHDCGKNLGFIGAVLDGRKPVTAIRQDGEP